MVELGEVCEIYQPKTITSKEIKQIGKYKVFGANGMIGFYDKYNHEDAEVLITCRGATCGTVNMSEPKSWITGNAMVVKPRGKLDKNFLFYFLRNTNLKSVISGSAQPQITRASLSPFKIPLPPIEVQKEIVEQIEVKQKAISAAKAVIDNLERERRYFGQEIRKIKGIEWVEFPKYVFFQEGPGIRNWQFTNSGVKLLNVKNIVNGQLNLENSDKFVSRKEFESKYKHFLVEEGDIILASSGASWGKTAIFNNPGFDVIVNTSNIRLYTTNKKNLNQRFLKLFLETDIFKDQIKKLITGSAQLNFGPSHLKQVKLPLPFLEIQKQLVAEMEEQEKIIEANKKLVGIMEQKITEVLDEI